MSARLVEKQSTETVCNNNRHPSGRTRLRVQHRLCIFRRLFYCLLHINLIIKFKAFHRARTGIAGLSVSVFLAEHRHMQSGFYAVIIHKTALTVCNSYLLVHVNIVYPNLAYQIFLFSCPYHTGQQRHLIT